MNCTACQKPLQPEHRFCPYCGTPAKLTCISCGKETQAEWVSCPYCGTNLKKPAVQPPIVPPAQPGHPGQPYHDYRGGHYSTSSSGHRHRRKKGLLERFFS